MDVPLEFVDRYARTFIDFWRLGGRHFLLNRRSEPESYLSGYQFIAISLGLTFGMLCVIISLALTYIRNGIHTTQTLPDPEMLAGQTIVIVTMVWAVSSFFWYALSRLPPIRVRSSLPEILEFNCYLNGCTVLPMYAIFVIVGPTFLKDIVLNHVSLSALLVGYGVIILFGMIVTFVYTIPGIALISGVKNRRVVAALGVWMIVMMLLFALLGFFYGLWVSLN